MADLPDTADTAPFVPPEGCYAVIFTSRRREPAAPVGQDADDDGYAATAQAMVSLAKQQPGFLGLSSARTPGEDGITISYWRSRDDIAAWRSHADHAIAIGQGRERWYSAYSLVIARVEHGHAFPPEKAPNRPA